MTREVDSTLCLITEKYIPFRHTSYDDVRVHLANETLQGHSYRIKFCALLSLSVFSD